LAVIKPAKQPSARVAALLHEMQTGDVDGNWFSEQLRKLEPEEQAHLVAGLLSAYKAVCESGETIH
jgi:hypothetical protein